MTKNYIYEDKDETQFCAICGSDSAYYVFEGDEDDGKFYCTNCECEFMYVGTEYRDVGDLVVLSGEKREWLKYLNENLTLPFEGVILEFQERGSIRQGDIVLVEKIEFEDDFYGIIVTVKAGNKGRFSFPIADIEAKDKNSPNYKMVDDYSTWFVNYKEHET